MRLLFALLFSYATPAMWASDQPAAPDCPPAEAFQYFFDGQTNAAKHVGHLLAMTDFDGWTNNYCRMSQSGAIRLKYHALKFRLLDSGVQSWHVVGHPLDAGDYVSYPASETQLKATISIIRELPATNSLAPIDHLVLISLHEGTNWVTRSYDKRSPPKGLDRFDQVYRFPPWERNFTVR